MYVRNTTFPTSDAGALREFVGEIDVKMADATAEIALLQVQIVSLQADVSAMAADRSHAIAAFDKLMRAEQQAG